MSTSSDVAQYMLDQLNEHSYLYQEVVVYNIQNLYGDDFVYTNENGNLAIARPVLTAFRKLTKESVVWERGDRLWRFRESYDQSGRQQD